MLVPFWIERGLDNICTVTLTTTINNDLSERIRHLCECECVCESFYVCMCERVCE